MAQVPYNRKSMCLCYALVPASDEEEGAVLFDNSGKAAVDPFDTSSGSVQLIGIKPTALPVVHPTSDRSQEPAVLNGEVSTPGQSGREWVQPGLCERGPMRSPWGPRVQVYGQDSGGRFYLRMCRPQWNESVHQSPQTSLLSDVFGAFSTFIRESMK